MSFASRAARRVTKPNQTDRYPQTPKHTKRKVYVAMKAPVAIVKSPTVDKKAQNRSCQHESSRTALVGNVPLELFAVAVCRRLGKDCAQKALLVPKNRAGSAVHVM